MQIARTRSEERAATTPAHSPLTSSETTPFPLARRMRTLIPSPTRESGLLLNRRGNFSVGSGDSFELGGLASSHEDNVSMNLRFTSSFFHPLEETLKDFNKLWLSI